MNNNTLQRYPIRLLEAPPILGLPNHIDESPSRAGWPHDPRQILTAMESAVQPLDFSSLSNESLLANGDDPLPTFPNPRRWPLPGDRGAGAAVRSGCQLGRLFPPRHPRVTSSGIQTGAQGQPSPTHNPAALKVYTGVLTKCSENEHLLRGVWSGHAGRPSSSSLSICLPSICLTSTNMNRLPSASARDCPNP